MFAFLPPAPAYRPQGPQHPKPEYVGLREPRTLEMGTCIQKTWLATFMILTMVVLVLYGACAFVFQALVPNKK